MMPSRPAPAVTRRPDLDWIRVLAFFTLIVFHVGMFYGPWEWHVKSPHEVAAMAPVLMATSPWRLSLLFLVSGAATRFMADKMTVAALTKARLARLVPPLVFAVLVIVPPQTYYQVIEQAVTPVETYYPAFYLKYLTGTGHWCRINDCLTTPTYNHMWFVSYLLAYSLGLSVLLGVAGDRLRAVGPRLEAWLTGWRLLALPFMALCALDMLQLRFPITHWMLHDWYNHFLSFTAFLFGFLIAKSLPLRDGFVRWRWWGLALAVPAYAVVACYTWAYPFGAPPAPLGVRALMRLVYAAQQWGAIVAALGFGARHLNRDGPVLRYLVQAVFPFYLVHQTIIVVAGHNLAPLGLPQGVEAAILVVITFAGCFATYEIVRRANFLRPWFGLKRLAPPSTTALETGDAQAQSQTQPVQA
ncbi:acyltransferase family protein [Nitrospirillum sp. BR 11163]|uniref:acyltransferase family protein n=1 Tax=Nitrospirillum sp. BR 11163 TaxID=3104323 RepID=UPI002B0024AF|nr:acyltransferase family protein [Nitrospirillum sp. BR 11163]MEA1676368.1 acyltransferase family protein [Nitrospirillum sp. BR 11163]